MLQAGVSRSRDLPRLGWLVLVLAAHVESRQGGGVTASDTERLLEQAAAHSHPLIKALAVRLAEVEAERDRLRQVLDSHAELVAAQERELVQARKALGAAADELDWARDWFWKRSHYDEKNRMLDARNNAQRALASSSGQQEPGSEGRRDWTEPRGQDSRRNVGQKAITGNSRQEPKP